uniref:Secreted protein n=1 Tax=Ditylenchus dipsaci TaxID=166011 RepID=A0A915CYK7_9BILA
MPNWRSALMMPALVPNAAWMVVPWKLPQPMPTHEVDRPSSGGSASANLWKPFNLPHRTGWWTQQTEVEAARISMQKQMFCCVLV